jgi:hypothetical protein
MNARPGQNQMRRLIVGLHGVSAFAGRLACGLQNHPGLRAKPVRGHSPPKAMNQLILKETWSSLKERLKQKYANLTDNDLAYIQDKEDEMLEQILRKTGESREEIEKCLREECAC